MISYCSLILFRFSEFKKFTDSNQDSLKRTFDLSVEFINLKNCLNKKNMNSLLLRSKRAGVSIIPQSVNSQCIKHLLDRRANSKTKDIYGNTCLHNVFRFS